jgi:pSer/pThr/pTyr-binding forkhead associated (FHA) protein
VRPGTESLRRGIGFRAHCGGSFTGESSLKAEVYLEDDPEFRFALLDGLTIGREGDVNVSRLKDSKYVSRVHATFLKEGDSWYIRDEKSRNSTFVNSVRLEPGAKKKLKNDDLISLGYMSFIFVEK